MNSYNLKPNELVLLLGEGNFSFSLALLQLNKQQSDDQFTNFYSTCYEADVNCTDTLRNISEIESHGFNVKIGVDATKLSEHIEIGSKKFNKIIFNFPHIKGKMKINLNRDLIKEFFISSKSILCESGVVIIALCSGQGGTQFDKNPRKWENTWQVVEMAAHGDYVLRKVEPFPNDVFPHYISSGFRGKSKSFNTVDALVYEFRKSSPPVESIGEIDLYNFVSYHNLPGYDSILVPFIYSKLLYRNPLKNDSPQQFIKNILLSCDTLIVVDNLPMTVSCPEKDHVVCKINKNDAFLRKSLTEVLPNISSELTSMFCGVTFLPLTSNFSICPVKCEIVIVGPSSKNICHYFCDKLKNMFSDVKLEWSTDNSENNQNDKLLCLNVQNELIELILIKTIIEDNKHIEISTFNLDAMSMCFFNIESWKQLWSQDSLFTEVPKADFIIPLLSSQTYSFDINFITNPTFSLENFINLLWQVGDNNVSAVLLLNTYEHSDNQTTSHCYRIVYKSYEKPLFRKRVVKFHENVIGKALQLLYNVVIC